MADDRPVEMDADEVDRFLGDGGTGVIALSTTAEEPPHSIPVSYGYDARERTFYFRLVVGPDGSKGELADRPLSFVTYANDDEWRSVVAWGHLEDVEDGGVATEALAGLDRVHIPLIDVFHTPMREVAFEFYRFVPDELTGRVESTTSA